METFKRLSAINVKAKIEKKGNVEYLSWSNAWGLAKQEFPTTQRRVYEDSVTGLNYFNDGKTGYVKVGIEIDGLEHIDYLPIMDFRNKSIGIDSITSMDVNKTIQRSTVKAIAMHGLGLSLWSGEDLVTTTAVAKKPTGPLELTIGDANWDKVIKYIKDNKHLGLATIVKNLETKYKISTVIKKELGKYVG
jgi:hypothetical protein